MTLTAARKILGLSPDADPRPKLDGLAAARDRIAEMVKTAPNEKLASRYRHELAKFENALAVVNEHLGAEGSNGEEKLPLQADNSPVMRGSAVFVPENECLVPTGPAVFRAAPVHSVDGDSGQSSGGAFRVIAWCLVLLCPIGFGGWLYLKIENDRAQAKRQRVEFLDRQGSIFIENRRWPEAEKAFAEIEAISPESELVALGRKGIEEGKAEEQNQFIGYWKGEAIAAFEASRWDDSEKAARQVLEKYPDEEEITALIARIADAKRRQLREQALEGIRKSISDGDFEKAISDAQALSARDTEDAEVSALILEASAARDKATADLMRARELAASAAGRDTGQFDEQAMAWMREALALAPDDADIRARYEKMASYTRTIRVPADVKTLDEALASAREKDRIVLAEGTWEGAFVIAAGIELQGVSGKTVVQCAADAGSALSFSPGVKGARVSGLTVRHLSFDAGAERFSLAHVRGAEVDFSDCRFEQGSGHGIAVTDGGHAKVTRCRFTENGWNGIAVTGPGSLLEAEKNILSGNFQNGIEAWDGSAVILSNNECTGNSRNGIHVDCVAASATVQGNALSGNREYGIVISSAGAGKVTDNTMEKNLLGGMVVKAGGAKLTAKDNRITANEGPGLVLEKGVFEDAYSANSISGNGSRQIVSGVDFSRKD